ncbi:DUF2243 domain-containing protein [Falsirhodobacter halotolerans]|uniref:DUF2243 domain-containing protein n=1 Tax=Falsirhodobacter halotolerans TaxID=1146892 RepID=UPI001FD49314|nr:DUF2243 domain-containing protein [Falsirhodobacter halotolerans]MCJ8139978.1 DUF2243 domain-containing protein [Falsirhodobacter halotolerans]
MTSYAPCPTRRSRSFTAGLPLGIGMMAAIDEIVFHQLLAWHHFVDRGTSAFALVSDGILHAGELIFMVLGFFLFGRLWRDRALDKRSAWAGFLTGLGGFQLFDGVVNHKLLRLHQVRYVETLWLYDLVWIGTGVTLLMAGLCLARRFPSLR